MKEKEKNEQEDLQNETKKVGKDEYDKSTSQQPSVTFYETVSLRIKTELMSARECERLRRITARDSRIIKDYLRIIFHNEYRILRKDGTVNISKLNELTLTTSKSTQHKLRASVPHDLKKRYPRCSVDEFQECRDRAVWTYENWKVLQNNSRNELSKPSFKQHTPRPLFKGTGTRGNFQVFHKPTNTEAKLWLELRDSLDTKRSGKKRHKRLWLPLAYSPYHEKKLELAKIKMLKLVYRSKEQHWWAHFSLQYSIPIYQSALPPAVLGVDLGIKKTAVAVLLTPTGKVVMDELRFIVDKKRRSKIWQLDKQIKDTQRLLNKSLNTDQHTQQLNKTLFRLRRRLRSVTEQELGCAVNRLVEFILQLRNNYNLFVSIGYPKKIQNCHHRGCGNKSLRKQVHKWCYRYFITKLKFQLTKYGFESHRVIAVNESWTSKTCSRCNSTNTTRTGQGQFNCHQCNYELDADLNGAKNIGKRLIQYVLKPKLNYIKDILTRDYHPKLLYKGFQPLGQWLK